MGAYTFTGKYLENRLFVWIPQKRLVISNGTTDRIILTQTALLRNILPTQLIQKINCMNSSFLEVNFLFLWPRHLETSQLICIAIQFTSFYLLATFTVDALYK